jgi:cytochrome c
MSRTVCSFLVLALVLLSSSGAVADAGNGRILAQQWCLQCHGVRAGELSTDPKAPSFSAIAAESSATEYALRVFLRTPHPTMPNFILGSEDIDDLVSYIVSLRPN